MNIGVTNTLTTTFADCSDALSRRKLRGLSGLRRIRHGGYHHDVRFGLAPILSLVVQFAMAIASIHRYLLDMDRPRTVNDSETSRRVSFKIIVSNATRTAMRLLRNIVVASPKSFRYTAGY
jgi:hypothetical protein